MRESKREKESARQVSWGLGFLFLLTADKGWNVHYLEQEFLGRRVWSLSLLTRSGFPVVVPPSWACPAGSGVSWLLPGRASDLPHSRPWSPPWWPPGVSLEPHCLSTFPARLRLYLRKNFWGNPRTTEETKTRTQEISL